MVAPRRLVLLVREEQAEALRLQHGLRASPFGRRVQHGGRGRADRGGAQVGAGVRVIAEAEAAFGAGAEAIEES